ncbi:hypothetical protein ONE63_010412 [Megalurothrips usitatus]|uniref:Lipocalin/cytosolic fatty-acid binding domain-containing protein n=1 Tax=Megalurothrips usitatus TaxID=439358 RepID=A0AAV7XH63_9NEOP|nr:hypothetical protein ONE63_010412 [Megalurothrips usitatus]
MARCSAGLLLTGVLALAALAAAHKYHTGSCPTYTPLKDFDMNKFLGDWYVYQKTDSSDKCLVNNYALDPEKPGVYKLEQSSVHPVLGLTSRDGRWRYNGELSLRPNATSKADLQVKYSLNPGTAVYAILLTDYDNFAAVVSCQDLPIGYRVSATVLSRKPTLDAKLAEKAREALAKNNMETESLSVLVQGEADCKPPNPGEGFHGAVHRAGDAINQGVQAVKDGAIKLYNKVRGNGSAESMEGVVGNYTVGSDKDAEWLP